MARAASCDAAALQRELGAYLRERSHPGDAERIAQRLAREHGRGSPVVGFRRRGKEVLLRRERSDDGAVIGIHEVGRDGRLDRSGTIRTDCDLERWLERHRYFLEWVRPDLRPERGRDGFERADETAGRRRERRNGT